MSQKNTGKRGERRTGNGTDSSTRGTRLTTGLREDVQDSKREPHLVEKFGGMKKGTISTIDGGIFHGRFSRGAGRRNTDAGAPKKGGGRQGRGYGLASTLFDF